MVSVRGPRRRLTTAEIARAFLVPTATMTRRITRAKASVARQRCAVDDPGQPARTRPLGALLSAVEQDERLTKDHRLYAVRAHLLELSGDRAGAREAYEEAARRTTSLPRQRYLNTRANNL